MDQSNPKSRLTPEEIEDLEVVVQLTLPDDTKAALIKNFPPEQLQEWDQVHQRPVHGVAQPPRATLKSHRRPALS